MSSVQAATTTALTVDGPVEYGGVPTANAEVTQAGTSSKPSGSVAFTYAGKTVTVAVKGGKAKTDLPQALTMGTNKVTAVFTPTDKDKAPSQTTATFTVVRGPTTSTAALNYRDVRGRLVAKALVASVNETDVTGRVRFTVKRDGIKIRTAIVDLNSQRPRAQDLRQHPQGGPVRRRRRSTSARPRSSARPAGSGSSAAGDEPLTV